MSLIRIKCLLVGWPLMIVFTWIPLVTLWFRLERLLSLLAPTCQGLFSLMSHQIDLSHLGVTCNFFNMMCCRLWCLQHLCKLPDFACRKLLQICITIIDGLVNKFFIFEKKNQNVSLCKILAIFVGYLARDTCACTVLYYSSTELLSCLKLVSWSHLALTSLACGLQKSSYLAQIVCKLRSSVGKHQETYWSFLKSLHHAMIFLYFIDSSNIANSQSRIFSHFSFYLRNLWYRLSFTIQSILDPSIYGINMGGKNCCAWHINGWKLGGLYTSISWSQLEDSCKTMVFSWVTFVLISWAEFLLG